MLYHRYKKAIPRFLAYFNLGKNDLALLALTEAPKPDSKDCDAFRCLGWYYYKIRNYEMAVKYAEFAIKLKLKPAEPSTQAALFEIYYAVAQDKNDTAANRRKYLGLAKKYLKLYLVQAPNDERAFYYRCVLLREHAFCKPALKYYQSKKPEIGLSNDKVEKIKELKAMMAAKKK